MKSNKSFIKAHECIQESQHRLTSFEGQKLKLSEKHKDLYEHKTIYRM